MYQLSLLKDSLELENMLSSSQIISDRFIYTTLSMENNELLVCEVVEHC